MTTGVSIPCTATYSATTFLTELNFNATTLCSSNCSAASLVTIRVTNLLNWPDTTPQTSGTLEFAITTSAATGSLAMSSGSIAFSSVIPLTAYPIDCTVTRTPNFTQGIATNFSLNFTTPSILLDNAIMYVGIPKNQ